MAVVIITIIMIIIIIIVVVGKRKNYITFTHRYRGGGGGGLNSFGTVGRKNVLTVTNDKRNPNKAKPDRGVRINFPVTSGNYVCNNVIKLPFPGYKANPAPRVWRHTNCLRNKSRGLKSRVDV